MDQINREYNNNDSFFEPEGAYEHPDEATERLKGLTLTGEFSVDAKAFLKAIGQGSHALERGDEESARSFLQSLLNGYRVQKFDDADERELNAERLRVLEQLLK